MSVTFFSIPKPFEGHIGLIQQNALRSWTTFFPGCEVLLFGNELGVKEAAEELRLVHVPDIVCSRYGTPLISDLFQKAQKLASYDWLCTINSDDILPPNFVNVITETVGRMPNCLITGRRWNVDVKERLDFKSDLWVEKLFGRLSRESALDHPSAMDYFVFKRGAFGEIPPFAVGRPMWDGWLIYEAKRRKIPVIDATSDIQIIHQKHGYSRNVVNERAEWEGPEVTENIRLSGGVGFYFSTLNADWISEHEKLRRPELFHSNLHSIWDGNIILFLQKYFPMPVLNLWLDMRALFKKRRCEKHGRD